jgi:enoyl-CoA hydratase/carnithine racemase
MNIVQVHCMGGGLELSLGCELIVAAQLAQFLFPEGCSHHVAAGRRLPACRPNRPQQSDRLVLLSEPNGAARLAERNVVDRTSKMPLSIATPALLAK